MTNIFPKIGWILFIGFFSAFAIIWYVYVQIRNAVKLPVRPVREDSYEEPRERWTYEYMRRGPYDE